MMHSPLILSVEDDAGDRILLRHAVRRADLPVQLRQLEGGKAAIDYFSGRGAYADREHYPLPDLTLLDIHMIPPDGFEVLEWLRLQPPFRTLPAIMLTSSIFQADRATAARLDADGFIEKDARFQNLLQALGAFGLDWIRLHAIQTPAGPFQPHPSELELARQTQERGFRAQLTAQQLRRRAEELHVKSESAKETARDIVARVLTQCNRAWSLRNGV